MNNKKHSALSNSRGFTLIEMLIAMAMGMLILGVTYQLFIAQQKNMTKETRQLNARAKARMAMNVLVEELRRAGAGLPIGTAISATAANSVTFRTNLSGLNTTLPVTGTGNTLAAAGVTTFNVVNGTGFSNLDQIYLSSPTVGISELLTVSNSTATTLTVTTGLTNNYIENQFGKVISVNKADTTTIAQVGSDVIKTVNGVAIPLARDVVTNGLTFTYNNVTAALVDVIGIQLTVQDATDNTITFTMDSDVNVRNN